DPGAQQVVVDGQLPPLFGLQPKEAGRPYVAYPTPPLPVAPASAPFRHDQVFEPHAFFELIDRLWAAHRAGGSALCRQRGLAVRDNPRFGIQGGGLVDVLWVYNAPVAAFRDRLGDIVRLGMDADPLLYGRFPNYDTILQLHLTPRQVNLLAHLSCWNVINEQSIGGVPPKAGGVRTMCRSAALPPHRRIAVHDDLRARCRQGRAAARLPSTTRPARDWAAGLDSLVRVENAGQADLLAVVAGHELHGHHLGAGTLAQKNGRVR